MLSTETKYFHCHARRHSDIYADSTGHRSNRRGCDRLPRSDLTRSGYGPSHAFQIIRDRSTCRLR